MGDQSTEPPHTVDSGFPVLVLLRCCSVRFTAYYWVGYAMGLAAATDTDPVPYLLGVPMWLACCLGTEAVNRITDRAADEVNRSERTALCARFGWHRLRRVAWASWAVFVLAAAALVAERPGLPLALLCLAEVGIAVGYSAGPALKRRRVLALLALTMPLILPMVTGWLAATGGHRRGGHTACLVAVLGAFSLGLAGIKDVTDVEGDRRIGYSSLWMAAVRLRRGRLVLGFAAAPFVVVAGCVALGGLPASTLALCPAVLVSWTVVLAAGRAADSPSRDAVREVMHQYTFYFLTATLLLAAPRASSAAVAGVGVCCWLVASQTLHWSGGLSRARLAAWSALLVPPSHSEEAP